MVYDINYNNNAVKILEDRILTVTDCIQMLYREGYIPNKNKYVILNWSWILLRAYNNLDIYSDEQRKKLDVLANKILAL